MIKVIFKISRVIVAQLLRLFTPIIIDGIYGGFWKFRNIKVTQITHPGFYQKIYYYYQEKFNCYIGKSSEIFSEPIFPHNMYGVFISDNSVIGKEVVIFQHVTIGSNTLIGHPRNGAPIIGNNVYIGAGAKIIGKVKIGDNCRIGANCVVVEDMPPNTTAVAAKTRFLSSSLKNDNTFISIQKLKQKWRMDIT